MASSKMTTFNTEAGGQAARREGEAVKWQFECPFCETDFVYNDQGGQCSHFGSHKCMRAQNMKMAELFEDGILTKERGDMLLWQTMPSSHVVNSFGGIFHTGLDYARQTSMQRTGKVSVEEYEKINECTSTYWSDCMEIGAKPFEEFMFGILRMSPKVLRYHIKLKSKYYTKGGSRTYQKMQPYFGRVGADMVELPTPRAQNSVGDPMFLAPRARCSMNEKDYNEAKMKEMEYKSARARKGRRYVYEDGYAQVRLDAKRAANKIGDWFLDCKYNPKYKYCRVFWTKDLDRICEEEGTSLTKVVGEEVDYDSL